MDPSEYENTVEKSENALNAGIFEEMIVGKTEKFVPFDPIKEVGDLYLTLFNCQESLKKFPGIQSTSDDYCQEIDEKALKVAEMKEEYMQRRKKLTSVVKKYTNEVLPKLNSELGEEIKAQTQDLVDNFKKEFDHLTSFAKFCETAFLGMFKDTREYLIDSKLALEQSVRICMTTQEVASRVTDQFRIAESLLTGQNSTHNPSHNSAAGNSSLGSSITAPIEPLNIGMALSETEKLQQKYQDDLANELNALREKYETELVDLKTSFERRLQTQEMSLYETFDQRQHEAIQRLEDSINSKDQEISSLLNSLSNLQAQALQSSHRQEQYETEQRKRQVSEDKNRSLLLDVSNLESQVQRLRKEQEGKEQETMTLRHQLTQLQDAHHTLQSQFDTTVQELRQKLTTFEIDRVSNPPKNLQDFASKISFYPHQSLNPSLGNASDSYNDDLPETNILWKDLEDFILTKLQRQDHELMQFRRQEQQRSNHQSDWQGQIDYWKRLVQDKDNELQQLEKDLMCAQQQMLLYPTAALAGASGPSAKAFQQQQQQKPQEQQRSAGIRNQNEEAEDATAEDRDLVSLLTPALQQLHPPHHKDHHQLHNKSQNNDFPDKPTAASSSTSTALSNNDSPSVPTPGSNSVSMEASKMLQESLVKQRDRFLKARRDLEDQVRRHREQEDQYRADIDKLTQENVLLYERLTQVQEEQKQTTMDLQQYLQQHPHHHSQPQQRRSSTTRTAAGTTVDSSRYLEEEEEVEDDDYGAGMTREHETAEDVEKASYSNFRRQQVQQKQKRQQQQQQQQQSELDKRYHSLAQEHYLTKLIPGQQWWATLLRALFTDPYTRHAVFLYLFLLHCCATMYIAQILTPQLQEEIEAQQKAQWNLETLSKADLHYDIHE